MKKIIAIFFALYSVSSGLWAQGQPTKLTDTIAPYILIDLDGKDHRFTDQDTVKNNLYNGGCYANTNKFLINWTTTQAENGKCVEIINCIVNATYPKYNDAISYTCLFSYFIIPEDGKDSVEMVDITDKITNYKFTQIEDIYKERYISGSTPASAIYRYSHFYRTELLIKRNSRYFKMKGYLLYPLGYIFNHTPVYYPKSIIGLNCLARPISVQEMQQEIDRVKFYQHSRFKEMHRLMAGYDFTEIEPANHLFLEYEDTKTKICRYNSIEHGVIGNPKSKERGFCKDAAGYSKITPFQLFYYEKEFLDVHPVYGIVGVKFSCTAADELVKNDKDKIAEKYFKMKSIRY